METSFSLPLTWYNLHLNDPDKGSVVASSDDNLKDWIEHPMEVGEKRGKNVKHFF